MNLREQMLSMLELQNKMNIAAIGPNWIHESINFHRAIIVETAEAMEHYGWKWWKKQNSDLGQFKIEMVDIWHFALSALIVRHSGDLEAAADQLCGAAINHRDGVFYDGKVHSSDRMKLLDKLDMMASMAGTRRFAFELFWNIMRDVGMTINDLYQQYVGKNILNMFRQAHGYKDGTYVKIWKGHEDNVWLEQIMEALDIDTHVDYVGAVREALEHKYIEVMATR